MLRKTITLTDHQNDWVKSQINSGKYGNDSEYIRDLIRADEEKKKEIAFFRAAIIEGEESGIYEGTMDDIWNEAMKRHNIDV